MTDISIAKTIAQHYVMLHCPTCGSSILADGHDDPWFIAKDDESLCLSVACVCGANHCVLRSGAKHVHNYFVTTLRPVYVPITVPSTISADDAVNMASVVGALCTTTSEAMPVSIQDAFSRLDLTQGMPLVNKISSLVAFTRFDRLTEIINSELETEYEKYGHDLQKHLHCVACGEKIVLARGTEPAHGRSAGEGKHACVHADVFGAVMSYICLPMVHSAMTFTVIPKTGAVEMKADVAQHSFSTPAADRRP
jgi:ribosomal protein S27AE